tara:strand:+ start:388 stop:651 length:264 start_codon:yes stop_codon:yes gene_type:complete
LNNDIPETKFNVKIYQKDKALRVAKSAKEALKGVVSKKKISILQKDTIHCPLIDSERSFVECFACESFIRRVTGEVHCSGIKATIFK